MQPPLDCVKSNDKTPATERIAAIKQVVFL